MINSDIRIGIYCASSQTGRAFFSDLSRMGYSVYGYVRKSVHGNNFLNDVLKQGGIYLDRPINDNNESGLMIPVTSLNLGHDLKKLIHESDFLIIAEPSHYLLETIFELKQYGLAESRVPIIVAPPRTFAIPYLWNALGNRHPFICFSTSPYSCKSPTTTSSYIKRRKRCWVASLEGNFKNDTINNLKRIFPQAIISSVPAVTSIGNIGAVFHPTPYIMKYKDICLAEKEGRSYSYYVEAIAKSPDVSSALGEIDQIRLKIADSLGLETFGLIGNEREREWKVLMNNLRRSERDVGDIKELRHLRSECLCRLNSTIVSAQHWLDYTYGVTRIPGESIGESISRTPTYQKLSVPQRRYIEEDMPSSFIPLMKIAERLEIDVKPMKKIVEGYHNIVGQNKIGFYRDLKDFSNSFILDYLKGMFFESN